MQNQFKSTDIKRQSKSTWLEHIKQWELSTLSQQAYCKQAGISFTSFGYWRKQFLLESGQSKSNQFIPVEVQKSQSDTSQLIKIKLITGHVVSIPTSIGISELAKLIRMLEA